MPRVGFEPTIPEFEGALDRTATAIFSLLPEVTNTEENSKFSDE
jgi:hypothetical protein